MFWSSRAHSLKPAFIHNDSEERSAGEGRTRKPSMRQLLKGCQEKLSDLPLPNPFEISGLVENMEVARGRRILLMPVEDHGTDLRTACGLRVKTSACTFIVYRRRPTRNQTEHTILHELVHEWLDHGTSLSPEETARFIPAHVRQGLIERLGDVVIQARARYASVEEQEAELSATLIKRIARAQGIPADDMVSLLESSLSHPVAPPPHRR
jgi:hypothetical protein